MNIIDAAGIAISSLALIFAGVAMIVTGVRMYRCRRDFDDDRDACTCRCTCRR